MTDEQINISIAEACGWKYEKNETHAPDGSFWWSKEPEFPNYLNDLNAMHEAEATLDFEQAELFEDELYDVIFKNNDGLENPLSCRFSVWHATSRQRAEAFLKTIKKWNSDKI
jgi:hypothetical protein